MTDGPAGFAVPLKRSRRTRPHAQSVASELFTKLVQLIEVNDRVRMRLGAIMNSARKLFLAVGFACLELPLSPRVAAADLGLPVTDTTLYDQLSAANQLPGVGDAAMGDGESVSEFNGNLMVAQPSSPVLPVDGQHLSLSLSRVYNSQNVRLYGVRTDVPAYSQYLSGQSWVGLGWTSHLGRIFRRGRYSGDDTNWNYLSETFFEFPDGGLYRFEATVVPAFPNLSFHYYQDCVNNTPPPPCNINCVTHSEALCCQGPEDPCAGRDDLAERYEVQFPNGTTYRLEPLTSPPYVYDAHHWITNQDRGGYYTTRITDVHGNEIDIDYWGRAPDVTTPYPEAIKEIRVKNHPEMKISTEICTTSDVGGNQCPTTDALGMLKTVRTTGFQGTRSVAQQTIYNFYYSIVTIADSHSSSNKVALLSKVELTGSNGEVGGSYQYSYGTSTFKGTSVDTYGPLLGRIIQPLGAASEYRYGSWNAGSRLNGTATVDRANTGVIEQATYPSGLNADGSTTNRPRYSWSWSRDLRWTDCSRDETSFGVDEAHHTNAFQETGPDGRTTDLQFYGDPCGRRSDLTGTDLGAFGAPKQVIVYQKTSVSPDTAVTLRTVKYEGDYQKNTDGEIVRVIGSHVTTEYDDDTSDQGSCFDTSGSTVKTTKVAGRYRDDFGHWREIVQSGDLYMPLLNGTPVSRITMTNYLQTSSASWKLCWSNKHIIGAFDGRSVEEGKSALKRFEENYEFDCNGDVTSVRTKDEWVQANLDPNGPLNQTNQADDGNDLLTTTTYDGPTGNPTQVLNTGGRNYPDGAAAHTYSHSLTYDRGQLVSSKVDGMSYSDFSAQADSGGMLASSTDPNGLTTTSDYDALGRPLAVDPPGVVEYPTRLIYPSSDIKRHMVIRSPGSETSFQSTNPNQEYTEQLVDESGRSVQEWRAMPDGTKSTRVNRYDQNGRVVFASEWMPDATYQAAAKVCWAAPGGACPPGANAGFYVDGIPLNNSRPWGTVTFYGTPSTAPAQSGNPLQAIPDGLGRIRRVERADGSASSQRYCGPHVETQVGGIQNELGTSSQATKTTRQYFDAIGRLVLVDVDDGGADAVYSYDPRGNLERVNLVAQLPANPFEAWRNGQIPDGQVRQFKHDAAGRLIQTTTPESGREVAGAIDASGNLTSSYLDAQGHVLVSQDEVGLQRGYFFRNTYDVAGRLTKSERLLGSPSAPTANDVDRLQGDGTFESGTGSWEFGTIQNYSFTSGASYWRRVTYGQAACLVAPPGQSGSNAGLYFGDPSSPCSYSGAQSGAQAVRRWVIGVSRDDVLDFKFWRQVREGAGTLDRFEVSVVLGSTPVTSGRRILLRLDENQVSYAKWQHNYSLRPADLFTTAEWPEGTPMNLYLYITFEKGDPPTTGLGAGVLVDDVFLGRRARQTLASYTYDADNCAGASPPAGAACNSYDEPTNRYLGRLSEVLSYQDGWLLSKRSLAYRGMSGRVSGQREWIDWAGVGSGREFISNIGYDGAGNPSRWDAPYQPNIDSTREYTRSYKRAALDGVLWAGVPILQPGRTPPAVEYSAAGTIQALRFANGASSTYSQDPMYRPSSISVAGPGIGGGTQTLWSSGAYSYDGAGNVSSIGNQQFSYDLNGRLSGAQLQRQASAPTDPDSYRVIHAYDPFGNMIVQSWNYVSTTEAPPPQPPLGSNLFLSFSNKNQVTGDSAFAYDLNGRLVRFRATNNDLMAMNWDDQGRVSGEYRGDPAGQAVPVARNAHNADGFRIVRLPQAGDGKTTLRLTNEAGRAVDQFVDDPASGHPILAKEDVYGAGALLVERTVTASAPTLTTNSSLSSSGSVGLDGSLNSPNSVIADIRTPSGYESELSGIAPDANGVFWIPESALVPGQSNWVRIKRANSSAEPYSNPVSVAIDSTVNSSSANQVRVVSVSRDGTNVIIRWALGQSNGKKFKLYFTRTDTNQAALLTFQGLSSTTTQYSIPDQALASPCGFFSLTQTNSSGGQETSQSIGGDMTSPNTFGSLTIAPPGCGTSPSPPAVSSYSFADEYHHRDHLGSLRVVTDSGGWKLRGHDYYDFGRDLVFPTDGLSTSGTKRYTGHERDFDADVDHMVMRDKPIDYGFFASPDPAIDAGLTAPTSWNRYAYVRNNPMNAIDPTGALSLLSPIECWDDPGSCEPAGGGWSWFDFGGEGYGGGGNCYTTYVNGEPVTNCGGGGSWGSNVDYSTGPTPRTGKGGGAGASGGCSTQVIFSQTTGVLSATGAGGQSVVLIATSGDPEIGCMNNPECEIIPELGPIPVGTYTADATELSDATLLRALFRWADRLGDWGSFRMPLHPTPGTQLHNRGATTFFIHGGHWPGSEGCIDCGGGFMGDSDTRRLEGILRSGDGSICVSVVP